jgi:hypothetical protein
VSEYYDLMILKNEKNIYFEKLWDNFLLKWKEYIMDKDMYQFTNL